MALTIDSAAVLRAVADHPDTFPAVKADLDEIARKLLIKQLKARGTNAGLLRRICTVTREDNLKTILDGFTAADLTGLLKRVDPHGPVATGAEDPGLARRHIIGIANGGIEPSTTPRAPKKATKVPAKREKAQIGTVLESKVHGGQPKSDRGKKKKKE
jgi:hypothetical protein